MKVQVAVKTVCGRNLIYPVCDTAMEFANLLNQTTFTSRDILYIKRIGFEIEEILVPSLHEVV